MKVLFTDGTEGTLSHEESKNLYIQSRFTLESWQDLKNEMDRLSIISFEDPFVSLFSSGLVDIEYVKNQISSHLETREPLLHSAESQNYVCLNGDIISIKHTTL